MSFELLVVGLLALVLGIAFCCSGYRAFRSLIALWGFFAGFLLTVQAIGEYAGTHLLISALELIIALIVGLVLAGLAYSLYVAAVIILSASVGFWIGSGLMMATSGYSNHSVPVVVAGIIFALVMAMLTLTLNLAKLLIVISTSLGGASMIIAGVLLLLGKISLNDALAWNMLVTIITGSQQWSMLWLVITMVGILVQLSSTQRYGRGYVQTQFYRSGHKPVKL